MPDLSRPRVRRQVQVRLRDPIAPMAAYNRVLQRLVVGAMREQVEKHLLPVVRAGDASPTAARDALSDFEISRIIKQIQVTIAQVVDSEELRAAIRAAWSKVDLFNYHEQKNLIEQVVAAHRLPMSVPAINVFAQNPYFATVRDEFVTRNVALIKSLPADTFGQIGDLVRTGIDQGKRASTIAKDIEERLDVAASRAKLIARDQVLKHNGELAAVRQQNAGITHFTWYSSQDQRVRESHRALHGKVFAWAQPPMVDGQVAVPGQPIQCRCNAIPFFG